MYLDQDKKSGSGRGRYEEIVDIFDVINVEISREAEQLVAYQDKLSFLELGG